MGIQAVLITMVLVCGSVPPEPRRRAPQQSLDLTCALPSRTTLGEPLFLDCEFRNREKAPITLDLGWNRVGNFLFELQSAAGPRIMAVQPDFRGLGGISRSPELTILESGAARHRILLNEWVRVPRPGAYTLKATFNGSFRIGNGHLQPFKHNQAFPILIGPRSEAQLRATVDSLLARATKTRVAQERIEAIRAIAFMDDPVTVPALHQLAMYDMSPEIAIAALERIGNDAALSALQKLEGHPNAEIRASSRRAAARVRNTRK